MKRVILIVIDSMGIGALPDCTEYGDSQKCNTLVNVARYVSGLNMPNLQELGLGNLADIMGIKKTDTPIAKYGIMKEKSKGKDTTTGHWELAGLVLNEPFKTFPNGFDNELINEFIKQSGCKGILGNCPASGTKIIEDLHEQHHKTKYPIVYTSADSVFQIAVDVDMIPLKTLYKWCEIARNILNNGYNTSRVIARPFHMVEGRPVRISKDRRDYSLKPFSDTILNEISNNGDIVLAIGKIEDIFVKSGITHAIHTGSNSEGLDITLKAINRDLNLDKLKIIDSDFNEHVNHLIFTNLVDTDMLYGHRNDAIGYAKALEEIDIKIGEMIKSLSEDDLLIITADHGCDPTVEGTDHTREYVPVLVYNKNIKPKDLGIIDGFCFVAKTMKEWLYHCI